MATVFLFRSPSGEIRSARGETANDAANLLGQVLSWDADLNTLDLRRQGKTERWTFMGHREQAIKERGRKTLADLRALLGVADESRNSRPAVPDLLRSGRRYHLRSAPVVDPVTSWNESEKAVEVQLPDPVVQDGQETMLLTPTGVYRVEGRKDLVVQFHDVVERRATEQEIADFLASPRPRKGDRVLCVSEGIVRAVVLDGYFQGKLVHWRWNGTPYTPTPGQVLSVRATWDKEGFGSRPIVKEIPCP